jgi:hypothetical protein
LGFMVGSASVASDAGCACIPSSDEILLAFRARERCARSD